MQGEKRESLDNTSHPYGLTLRISSTSGFGGSAPWMVLISQLLFSKPYVKGKNFIERGEVKKW